MIRILAWTCCLWFALSCSSKKALTQTQQPDRAASISTEVAGLPVITFEQDTIHIGKMIEGESQEITFTFTNTGDATLDIEIVTACKCTSLEWPQHPIAPGGQGEITVEFDSTGFEGKVLKTIDIIANTDPIVIEGFFTAEVEAQP